MISFCGQILFAFVHDFRPLDPEVCDRSYVTFYTRYFLRVLEDYFAFEYARTVERERLVFSALAAWVSAVHGMKSKEFWMHGIEREPKMRWG